MIFEKYKKKKKKGQAEFGGILIAFVAIVVGLTLFTVIAQTVGTATSTVTVVNKSLGQMANGTAVYLTDYTNLDSVVIVNYTSFAVIPAGNYTVTNHFIHNGQETVRITPAVLPTELYPWNVSGTAEPLGYVSGASKSTALLIPIFFALLIAILALEPTLRNGLKDLMGI